MPVFEYQCEKCGKKMDAFQHGREVLKTCDEVNHSCKEQGAIHRLISAFAIKGDSSGADRFSEFQASPNASGCGCHGTSSCPSSNIHSKYGLN
jgi:putative FmdB family regulatory protein